MTREEIILGLRSCSMAENVRVSSAAANLIESQATEIKELKRRYHVLREAIRLIETESEKAVNDVEYPKDEGGQQLPV